MSDATSEFTRIKFGCFTNPTIIQFAKIITSLNLLTVFSLSTSAFKVSNEIESKTLTARVKAKTNLKKAYSLLWAKCFVTFALIEGLPVWGPFFTLLLQGILPCCFPKTK